MMVGEVQTIRLPDLIVQGEAADQDWAVLMTTPTKELVAQVRYDFADDDLGVAIYDKNGDCLARLHRTGDGLYLYRYSDDELVPLPMP